MAKKQFVAKQENKIILVCAVFALLLVGFFVFQALKKPNINYGLDELRDFFIANGYPGAEIHRNECGSGAIKFDTTRVCSDRLGIEITDTEEVVNQHLYNLIDLTYGQDVFAIRDDLRSALRTTSSLTHTGTMVMSNRNGRECSMTINVNHVRLEQDEPLVHNISYDVFCKVSK